MTDRAIRDEVARVITDHGAPEETAELIMRDLTARRLLITRIPEVVEPKAGPKAENHRPAYVKAKAAIAEAKKKKTSAATKEEA